ncbi:hypothetical protein ACFWBB_32335 [Streptomyces sp. NPDC060000]|uniref:hypothetical protein n=1 Tax=Streptomyces sp. NPDC060000 TaxID=3347031 RepID=UPI00368B1804
MRQDWAGSSASRTSCAGWWLRVAVRRREIRVVGANRWRNPEDDLPADFEDNRDVHYAALGQPQDAGEFIAALKGKLRTSLDRFEQALA